MNLKQAMNGAPVPNWVRVAAFWIALGWIAASQWLGSKATQDSLSKRFDKIEAAVEAKAALDAANLSTVHVRLDVLEEKVEDLDSTVKQGSRQANRALGQIDEKLDEVAPVIRKLGKR